VRICQGSYPKDIKAEEVRFTCKSGVSAEALKRRNDIKEAITYGVVKMNIDTDTQWAYWDGIRGYEAKNRDYLQAQIGNPEGESVPNKKFYDPRMPIRAAEDSTVQRLFQCFEDLNCVDILGMSEASEPANVVEDSLGVFRKRKGSLPV